MTGSQCLDAGARYVRGSRLCFLGSLCASRNVRQRLQRPLTPVRAQSTGYASSRENRSVPCLPRPARGCERRAGRRSGLSESARHPALVATVVEVSADGEVGTYTNRSRSTFGQPTLLLETIEG